MKAVIYSLFFFVEVMIYISCGICSKKIDCAGFKDTELLTWFPYQDNSQLFFSASLNERQTFTLKNSLTTQPYQQTGGPFTPRLNCYAEKFFESVEKDSVNRTLFSARLTVQSDSIKSAIINLQTTSIYFNFLRDTGFQEVYIGGSNFLQAKEKFAAINLGGQNFSNVIAVTRDTTSLKGNGIYKVYYAKNFGIIAYSEFPSLKTWVKQ